MVKRTIVFLLMACLLLAWLPQVAYAITPVEVDRQCSLSLRYSRLESDITMAAWDCSRCRNGFAQVEVRGYRIADVAADGTYTLTDDFADYPVNIYGITDQAEWKEVSSTLAAYAAADELEPELTAETDDAGTADFQELKTGMYLVCAVDVADEGTMYQFEDFIVCLPQQQEDGSFSYAVSAAPKYKSQPIKPQEVDFQVVKLWKDVGEETRRPSSVTVDILKNGEVYTSQTLSKENDWTYRWKAPDDGSRWQVAERDVPKGYQVAVGGDGRSFTLTNTYDGGQEKPPQTGDTTALWPLVLAMCLSGGGLILMGCFGMRKRS